METYKVVVAFDQSDSARRLAGGMAELLDPPPSGLTLFESGSGWCVEAYYDEAPDTEALAEAVSAFMPGEDVRLELVAVPDDNWVAISQAGLPPVAAGRFTIHGSHDSHRVPQGRCSILIDAGEAFGTAHHATTFTCLLAIDDVLRKTGAQTRFREVLDLGCGTGVLAIAMARALPDAYILATDVDGDSVRVAQQNAVINGEGNRIAFAELDGLPGAGYGFDLLVANILAGPLIGLAPAIRRAVIPGGTLVLSGILMPQAAAVEARYRSLGFVVQQHRRMAGWSTLTLLRRS